MARGFLASGMAVSDNRGSRHVVISRRPANRASPMRERDVPPRAHHLPHRRDRGDALSPGRGAARARRRAQGGGGAGALRRRPRVYFEEGDEPMISSIGWVAELVEIAGGIDAFPALSRCKHAKERIVSSEDLIAANPDIIIGSWCGNKVLPEKVQAKPGFADIPTVR